MHYSVYKFSVSFRRNTIVAVIIVDQAFHLVEDPPTLLLNFDQRLK